MKITIKDQEIELKQTLRSFILYENATQKSPDDIKTITDVCIYFYCVVLASSKDLELTLDEFLDIIDENPDIVTKFSEWLISLAKRNESVSDVSEKKGSKKKSK